MSKRAVIYVRVSSERQGEQDRTSPEDQERACRELCQKRGYHVAEVVTDVERYRGADGRLIEPSGGNEDRPGLQHLLELVSSGKVDVVVVWKVDRLSRDLGPAALIKRAHEHNPRWEIEAVADVFSWQMWPLLAGLASFQKSTQLQTVLRGRKSGLRANRAPGGRVRFGLMRDPISKRFVIQPEEAKIVRRILDRYARGGTTRETATKLRAEGVRGRDGRLIGYGTVFQIVRHAEVYASGQIVEHLGGDTFELTFPPIISESLYLRVRERARKNAVFSKRNTKHPALLQGLIRCKAHPTLRMTLHTDRKRPKYSTYVCRAPYRSAGNIKMEGCARSVSAPLIDGTVWDNLRNLWFSPLVVRHEVGTNRTVSKEKMDEMRQRIASLGNSIQRTKEERAYTIRNAAALGLDPKEVKGQLTEIAERRASLIEEKREAEGDLMLAEGQADFRRMVEVSNEERRAELKGRVSFQRKREIVKTLLDVLWVWTDANGTKSYQAERRIAVPVGEPFPPRLQGTLGKSSSCESNQTSSSFVSGVPVGPTEPTPSSP